MITDYAKRLDELENCSDADRDSGAQGDKLLEIARGLLEEIERLKRDPACGYCGDPKCNDGECWG